jgi:hypothetical protein
MTAGFIWRAIVVHLGSNYVRHPVIIESEVTEWVYHKGNDEFCEDVILADFSPNLELIDWPYISATPSLLEREFALALQKQVCFPVWFTSQFQEISAASCWWIYSLTLWYPRYMLQYRSKHHWVCPWCYVMLKCPNSCPIFWRCINCRSVFMSNYYEFRSEMKYRRFLRFTGLCDWLHEWYCGTRRMVLDLRECTPIKTELSQTRIQLLEGLLTIVVAIISFFCEKTPHIRSTQVDI